MKIKAVIFDFDGLLVNTEELRELSFVQFLEEKGKEFDHADYHWTMMGKTTEEVSRFLMDKYGLTDNEERVTRERRAIFEELFQSRLELMSGVSDVLEIVREMGVKCAIASNRNKKDVIDGLTRLGVVNMFEVIVNSDELENGNQKPDPEIYLVTAKKLGIDPSECLVLEDTKHGADAAISAGMRVIYVPNARYSEEAHKGAELILKSMQDFKKEILTEFISPRGLVGKKLHK